MLISLDRSLFSEKINLINTPHGWVYPIFKNGSTTMFNYCEDRTNFNIIPFRADLNIDEITIFIRQPIERYKSGIQTVVHHLTRDHTFLDRETVSFIIQKYLFLDVHFLPQFHWLLNLTRFIGPDIPLKLRSVEDIDLVFSNNQAQIPGKNTSITINEDNFLDLYLQLDEIIFNFIGSTITFNELLNIIKKDKDARFDKIINVPQSLMRILDY